MSETYAFQTIDYRAEEGVAFVTLNRPEKYNAFNAAMQRELHALWRGLRHDDTVRAVVLTGAGDKAFCTGIDRDEVLGAGASDSEVGTIGVHYDDPGDLLGPKTAGLWKPVVAAVNGMACGGAFYLLGEADIVIAAEHATFFDPHVTYGMVAAYETVHLAQRVPFGELLRMQLLGAHERVSATRALEIGLVSEVTSADALAEQATWIATTIASQPADAVQATVRAAWGALELPRSQALAHAAGYLELGTTARNLAEGQEFFASGGRVEPRVR
jgi:enoyl-CoA hydratase/carnithine racemase